MDAVTTVLVNRSRAEESLSSMLGASALAHTLLLIAVVMMPLGWFNQPAEPETVMRVTLSGAEGPNSGGLSALSARPVQQVTETPKTIEPIRPPAAQTPQMIEPVKTAPKKAETAAQDAKDPSSRTPTKGKEIETGAAVAQTSARGQGLGLSTGGGGGEGMKLDVANFCCPEYLAIMRDLILRNWNSKQGTEGITSMKFVIRRDGRIEGIQVARSSGSAGLDYFSQRALQLVGQFPPLPAGYDQPTLTVYLAFEYRR